MSTGAEARPDTAHTAARAAAVAALPPLPVGMRNSIRFERGNTVLILGDAQRAVALGVALASVFDVFVFATGAQEPVPRLRRLHAISQPLASIDGHIGRFRAQVRTSDGLKDVGGISAKKDRTFDLVLDLAERPLLARSVLPLGYYWAPDDATAQVALEQMRALPPVVEKPRYVSYDTTLCTHSASGISGCTRCLSVCPAQALASAGDRINVDFNLCQGCATCTAACPTGALSYAHAPRSATLTRLRTLLETYRSAGGRAASVLIHHPNDSRAGDDPRWLPLAVPALATFGLEHMLAALAWGAAEIALLPARTTPGENVQTLADQSTLAARLLALSKDARVRVVTTEDEIPAPRSLHPLIEHPAGELPSRDKRELHFAALDHLLAEQSSRSAHVPVELPKGASFGAVEIDTRKCTLCFACTQLCPTHALLGAEKSVVELGFVEQRCVQCGICEHGCPEKAIRLRPRLLPDADSRRRPRLLASDAMAACVECGTPFLSRRMLEASIEKVGHLPQFAVDGARRLRMCPECRQRTTLLDASGLN